ncbi:MAG: hypothetical protein J5612_04445 [Paludibacteraceae bacterium]|nr:hypothetical protein [Paludibacteraceae bacterium]
MRYIFNILLACICIVASAQNADRQTRRIVLDRVFECSEARTNAVIDTFVYALQTDINSLFDWAFIGTGNQGDSKGKDAVSIVYTGNTYEPETRTGVLTLTIYVLGVPWFKNRELGSVYRDSVVNETRHARLDITYSGSMLQDANGQFHTKALGSDRTDLHFELNVVLGKFFSALVTNKMWAEVAAWRIERIVDNLKEYAETGKVTEIDKLDN